LFSDIGYFLAELALQKFFRACAGNPDNDLAGQGNTGRDGQWTGGSR
jgi:hypothetical protein